MPRQRPPHVGTYLSQQQGVLVPAGCAMARLHKGCIAHVLLVSSKEISARCHLTATQSGRTLKYHAPTPIVAHLVVGWCDTHIVSLRRIVPRHVTGFCSAIMAALGGRLQASPNVPLCAWRGFLFSNCLHCSPSPDFLAGRCIPIQCPSALPNVTLGPCAIVNLSAVPGVICGSTSTWLQCAAHLRSAS